MKILAVKSSTGGNYHRIQLPLTFFKDYEINYVDKLDEIFIKELKPDVIFLHWNCNLKAWFISYLQKKYGFKLIVDIDDSWNIPKNHIQYKQLMSTIPDVKRLIIAADWVVTTNVFLATDIMKLNPNVQIIPNSIPYGFGQFKVKQESLEEFKSRRIKVGVAGGTNHFNDWMEIKDVIHKIAKLDCDFYFCGYREDNYWKALKKEFPECIFVNGRPADDYIRVYDLDIMLCPLEDNYFNKCKSDLKIHEAACNRTLCILDNLYNRLSYEGLDIFHFTAKNNKDYYKIVKHCLEDKDKLYQYKNNSAENVMLYSDYIKKAVQPRIELCEKDIREFKDYNIKSICYNMDQIREYNGYLNTIKTIEEKSYLFEYNVILQEIPKMTGKYIGIFSHKFGQKTSIGIRELERIIEKENSDIISFCKQIPDYINWTDSVHPGFYWRFQNLCLNLRLKPRYDTVVYSNFFVAKPHIYKEWIRFLQKAIDELEKEDYKCWNAVNYPGLPPEELEKATGLKYYPWHTFLLERLFCVWAYNKKFKIKNYESL